MSAFTLSHFEFRNSSSFLHFTMRPPSQKGQETIAIVITFSVLATLSTAARLYTRAVIIRNIGIDDGVVFISWVVLTDLNLLLFMVTETLYRSLE